MLQEQRPPERATSCRAAKAKDEEQRGGRIRRNGQRRARARTHMRPRRSEGKIEGGGTKRRRRRAEKARAGEGAGAPTKTKRSGGSRGANGNVPYAARRYPVPMAKTWGHPPAHTSVHADSQHANTLQTTSQPSTKQDWETSQVLTLAHRTRTVNNKRSAFKHLVPKIWPKRLATRATRTASACLGLR